MSKIINMVKMPEKYPNDVIIIGSDGSGPFLSYSHSRSLRDALERLVKYAKELEEAEEKLRNDKMVEDDIQ